MRKLTGRFALCCFLFFIDLITKWYTYFHIPSMSWRYHRFPYGGIAVFKKMAGISFSLNYVANKGAAWGLFSGQPLMLVSVRFAIIVCMLLYIGVRMDNERKLFPLGLILTGAIGNLADFFFYGHVVDMFHFCFGSYSFPVFNCSDVCITVGVLWLLVLSYSKKKGQANAN